VHSTVSHRSNARDLLFDLAGPGSAGPVGARMLAVRAPAAGTAPSPNLEHVEAIAAFLDDAAVRHRESHLNKPRLTWSCTLRTSPGERVLTDSQWVRAAEILLHTTRVAEVDDAHAPRWAAIRLSDHRLTVIASLVRDNGEAVEWRGDAYRSHQACRQIRDALSLEAAVERAHARARRVRAQYVAVV